MIFIVKPVKITNKKCACQISYTFFIHNPDWNNLTNLSHCLKVQLAIIQSDTIKTNKTVPGHIVINVFKTNRVLKFIRFRAPIDLEEASVNNLLCNSITRQIKYNLEPGKYYLKECRVRFKNIPEKHWQR